MLTSVEIRTESNKSLTLTLDEYDSEYYIKSITGLDPVKAEMTSTGVASIDGNQYQSSRRGSRNPVITLGLQDLGDKSIRTLRQTLYQFFMPKSPITMVFYDDEYEPLMTSGRVESFESPLFQRDPEATISIICFDPAFYELDVASASGTIPLSGTVTTDISYTGSIDNGVTLMVTINNDAGAPNGIQFTMQKANGVSDNMDIIYPFIKGDILNINTVFGRKSVTLTRNNQTDSILYALTYESGWISLAPGSNKLTIKGPTGATLASPYLMTWVHKHGGL